jgi:putative transposase
MEYKHDRHSVHLVWCPKRRKAVLVGEVANRLRQIIAEVATEKGWDILELSINPDHVHLFKKGQSRNLCRQDGAVFQRTQLLPFASRFPPLPLDALIFRLQGGQRLI